MLDLGEWWLLETGLPLPLGVNVARRDLGERLSDLSAVLASRSRPGSTTGGGDALRAAVRARDRRGEADRFVGMYVNELTRDYGDEGRQAVEELLRRGEALGAFPEPVRLDFVLAGARACARAASGARAACRTAPRRCICSAECTFCRAARPTDRRSAPRMPATSWCDG